MQRTVIVVPCYNEASRLQSEALFEASEQSSLLSFVLVDDGSRDHTQSVLEALRARAPRRIQVLALAKNQGKAEAVRQGMLAAFELSPSLVGYFDADLATPLAEVAPMAALFERPEVHLVLGSRVQLLGRQVKRSPLRHYVGRLFASSASLILGLEVYDTQCGAKLFRNTKAIRSVFERPFAVDWSFDVEIIARMIALSERAELPPIVDAAVEYPLRQWHDVAGSKLHAGAALQAALELAKIWRSYPRAKRR